MNIQRSKIGHLHVHNQEIGGIGQVGSRHQPGTNLTLIIPFIEKAVTL